MERLIRKFYHHPFISRLFHTLVYCLKKELKNCQTVLDLGCGPSSPLQYCQAKHSLGVEGFAPYLQQSKKMKVHQQYLQKNLTKLKLKPKSFDAVIMIDVLEHLKKNQGRLLLKKAENWASKKIIISTPSGYLPQASIDNNPLQAHRSGWSVKEMKKLGYKAYGMAGFKFLRKQNETKKMGQKGDIFSTIKFKPRIFWLIVSELSQIITYYWPKLAFSNFYIKNVK